MSLRIWLPLNGDIENKGSSGNDFTINTAPVFVNNGKIGKAMSSGSITMSAEMAGSILNNQEFSFACWIYVNAETGDTTNRAMIFGNNPMTGPNNRKFSIFQYPTCNDLHLSWQNDGDSVFIGTIWSGYFPSYQWTHLAVTYNNPKVTIYINGNQVSTYTGVSNSNSFAYNTVLFSNIPNQARYLNDYRIYDHCLSTTEVKELSQGLVLHYKLDGGIYGNPNLVNGSNTASTSTNTWNFSMQVGDKTNTIEYEDGAPIVVITRGTTEQSGWCFLSYNNLRRNEIKTSTTYTISFDIKSVQAGTISFTGFVQSNATNYMTNSTTVIQGVVNANSWSHIVLQCTTKNSFSDITIESQIVYMSPSTSLRSVGNIMKFKNIKVEEGTTETVWCPSDSEGIDRSNIEDSSGYNNNGTTLNAVSISSDSPRYSCSTNLEAGNSAINCGRGGMVTDSITVNLWFKSSSWANPTSCTEGGGWNFEGVGDYFRFPVYVSGVGYKYGQSATTRSAICNNQWHMLTGIYDRINQKIQIYVDGNLDNDYATGTSNVIGYNGTNVIWIGAEASGSNTAIASNGMIGLFSDFRIYCTALSANDIKQLYDTSMKVDNKNSIHTFDIEETSTNKLTKSGILKSFNFYENGYLEYLHYDKTIYTESDGSTWVHVFHHNNPASTLFNNSDKDWLQGKYISEDAWYDLEPIVSNLVNYEFLYRQKTTSSGSISSYRWIQTIDPMIAKWTDVSPSSGNIIFNTNGYTTSSMGGMYLRKSSDQHMCIANTNSSNWYGGIGISTAYQGGIPGYPNTTVTSGCIDLYVRIYLPTKIIKDKGISTLQFIEK